MVLSKTIAVILSSTSASVLQLPVGTGICAATDDKQYKGAGVIKEPHLAPINPNVNAYRENRLDSWAGDVTNNGVIDFDDAQLLVVQVFNLAKYIMTYNQRVYG